MKKAYELYQNELSAIREAGTYKGRWFAVNNDADYADAGSYTFIDQDGNVTLNDAFPRTHTTFLTKTNIFNVLRQSSTNLMLACGMTMVIILGGIDLSVGSIIAMSGVLAAASLRHCNYLQKRSSLTAEYPDAHRISPPPPPWICP